MKRLVLAATAALLTAAPLAAHDEAQKAGAASEEFLELVEGRVAGEAKSCISTFNNNDLRMVENVGLVYDRGDTIWIALARHPERLDYWDVPIIERRGSHLCKTDVMRTIDRHTGMFSGAVFLEDFVPYTKVEAAEAG